jgi:hypothetical protein
VSAFHDLLPGARRLLALAVALAAVAYGAALAAGKDPAARRALDYLRTTGDETGVDALVAVEAYGELSGDPLAAEVVRAARARVSPAELERFGTLLGRPKPPFPEASAAVLAAPSGKPDLGATDGDPRAGTCPVEALSCSVSESCLEFAARDTWGKALTHQALWLVFAHWRGCKLPVDEDALRRRYAARLLAEARADPVPSDLFFERLALMGHLGYGAAIEPEWIEAAWASQQPQGCFPADPSARCHPHPTALALWALGHQVRKRD